jgi:hypothetical protein
MSSSNTVTISGAAITAIDYVPNSLVITPGEDSSPPPTIEQDESQWTITLSADRKASTGVADSFNRVSGGQNHEYAPSGGGGIPEEMNFYFQIDMTLGASRVRLQLGQGNYGLRNNWWMGGNHVLNVDEPLLLEIVDNEILRIFKLSGGVDSFNLAPV